MYKREFEIDVMWCIRALFKRKFFIIVITLLSLIAGVGMNIDVGEDQYTSVATVYAASDNSYSDATTAVTAMNAYLDVATSMKVSERAALIIGRSDIDATDIKNSLYVNSSAKTKSTTSAVTNFLTSSATIISFYVTTSDPELSREIADAAAESYVIEMANILKTDSVKSLDRADQGTLSHNAKRQALKNMLKVMIAGFVLACLFVVVCEIFDTRVRSIREATIRNQLPIIGVIPDFKE